MTKQMTISFVLAAIFILVPFSNCVSNIPYKGDENTDMNNFKENPGFQNPWKIEFIESGNGIEIWSYPNGENPQVGSGHLEWLYLSHSGQKIQGKTDFNNLQAVMTKHETIDNLPYGIGQLTAWLVVDEVVAEGITELNVKENEIRIYSPNDNTESNFYQITKSEDPASQTKVGGVSPIPEEISSMITTYNSRLSGRSSTLNITYSADSISYPWQVGNTNNSSYVGWGPSNYTYTEGTGALWSAGYNYQNNTSNSCTTQSCVYTNNMYTLLYAQISLASFSSAADLNLTFDVNYNLENNYDYFQVYASTNSTSWTNLKSLTGTSNGWGTQTADLMNYKGSQSFTIYFVMYSDSSVSNYSGVFLDNISISGNVSTYPDLVADNIWAAGGITTGSSYSATAKLSNIGNASSGAFSTSIMLYNYSTTNYTLIKTYSMNSYSGNSFTNNSYTFSVPSSISPGTYYWVLYVDSTQSIIELNETNNVYFGNSVIVSAPTSSTQYDIVASSIYLSNWSSSSPCAGTYISITRAFYTTSTTAKTFEYGIFLSTNNIISTADTEIYNFTSTWSSSNSTISVFIPSTMSTGNYYVGLLVDPNKRISETNESNNYVATTSTIYVDNDPDLEAISVSGPTATTPGSSVSISRSFKNSGCGDVSGFRYGVYLSTNNIISTGDTLVSNRSFGSLSAGSTSTQSVSFTLPSSISTGIYYWGILLDPYDKVSEKSTSNNDKAASSSSTITGSGYVTVTAKFQYYNYYLANNSACSSSCYSNVKYAKAELWDEDTVSSDDLLATSYLDVYGNVKFSNVAVSEIGTNQDIYIKLYSTNIAAEVSSSSGSTNAKGTVYTWTTSVVTNVASGVYSYGTQSVVNNGAALNIMTTLLDSKGYTETYASSSIAKLDSRWPRSDGSTGAYYWTNGGSHIVLYDGFDATVNFHEYAHYVEDYYTTHTGGGGPHSFNSCTSEDLGWSEGWASYFAIAVKDRYSYLDDTWYKDWYEYEEGLIHYLNPARRNYNSAGPATVNNPANGTHWDCLEEVVTGILWDIHDGNDDDSWDKDGFGDTLGNYNREHAQKIWNAALGYNPSNHYTLADFTYKFLDNHPGYKEEYFDILVDHAIRPELSCSSSYGDAKTSSDAGSSTSTSTSLYVNNSDQIYTYHGCLSWSSDTSDYYSVSIPAGKELKVKLVSPANNNFNVKIVNSANNLLSGSTGILGMEWANWSSYTSTAQTVYVAIERFSGSGSMYGFTLELTNKTSPNLVAEWIGATSLIYAGTPVTANIALSNTGGNAGAFTYGIYLSQDSNITTSDMKVYYGSYSSYCGNCQSNFSVTVSIPNSLTKGSSYYWGLYVDDGFAISESSGSDNFVVGSRTTVGCGLSQNDGGQGIDFSNNHSYGYWLGWDPSTTLDGCLDSNDTLDYIVLGMNSGYDVDVKLTSGSTFDFDIDLMYYNQSSIDSSTSGGLVDWVSTKYTNASGNNNVLVIKIYRHSGAGDYSLQIWTNATYRADLEPTYLYGPNYVNPGQPLFIWREISNNGKLYSGQYDYSVYLSLDQSITTSDTLLATFSQNPGLGYGNWNYTNATFTMPTSISPGNYYWGIIVDATNSIYEDNESNNAIYGNQVQILACDYQQNDAGQSGDAPDFGGPEPYFNLNQGLITGCMNEYDTEDSYNITIGPHSRLEISLNSSLANGDFELVIIKQNGMFFFGNNTNNGRAINFTSLQGETVTAIVWNSNYEEGGDYNLGVDIFQLPDLKVNSISMQNRLQIGSQVSVNTILQNNGTTSASNFNNFVYLSKNHYFDSSDILLSTSQVNSISVGQTKNHNSNFILGEDIEEGVYYLCVYVNADHQLEESQFTNNWKCDGVYIETPQVSTPTIQTTDWQIINTSTFTINWIPSTSQNVQITGYHVVLNGEKSPLVTGTTYSLNLVEGVNTIGVYALNDIGDFSDTSLINVVLDSQEPSLPQLSTTEMIIGRPGLFIIDKPMCSDDVKINSTLVKFDGTWMPIMSNTISETLASGVTNVQFRCEDFAGNRGPIETIQVTTDLEPPEAPIIDGPTGRISAGVHYWYVNKTIDNGTGVSSTHYSLNEGVFRTITNGFFELHLIDGSHRLTIHSIDLAGNVGDSTIIDLNVDNSPLPPPTITIDRYFSTTDSITAILSEPSNEYHSHFTWSLNGDAENRHWTGTWQNDLDEYLKLDIGTLPEGHYTISVREWDENGNKGLISEADFIVDDTGPTIPDINCNSLALQGWHNSQSVMCLWETPYDEGAGVSHLEVSIDGGVWSNVTLSTNLDEIVNYGNHFFIELTDGEHEVSFRWVDFMGHNSEESNYRVNVDTIAPEINIIQKGIIDSYVSDPDKKEISANITIGIVEEGSGVAKIIYSFDGGNEWNYFYEEGGIRAPGNMNGEQNIQFLVIDYAGNVVEVDKIVNFAGEDPDMVVEESSGMFGDTNSSLMSGGILFVMLFGIFMFVLYRKQGKLE